VEWLLAVAAQVVLAGLATALRFRLARSRGRRVARGQSICIRGALALDGGRRRRGFLLIRSAGVRWHARRGDDAVTLDGARIVHTAPVETHRDRPLEVVLRLLLPTGGAANLYLFDGDAATLADVLAQPVEERPGVPLPPGLPPRWSRWAVVCVVTALAVLGVHGAMAVSAETTSATVANRDDGVCDVDYATARSRAQRGEVDCWDKAPVGSGRTIWVMSDDPGDVLDPVAQTVVMAGLALVVGVPGTLRLLIVRHRRRAWAVGNPVDGDARPVMESRA
jgi:hypothetical protein